jgi:LPXTG-site transpeptidase (sortase) family protein
VPGDIGPAVIAGHVDSVTEPAVFARLGELRPGDEVRVTLSTGAVEVFAVDSLTSAPKDAFPTQLVYGPTPTAQLRLITCDGVFNSSTGHYLDNLIVFASLAS